LIKVAYILTPVEFAGAEKVNLTFLSNVNRDQFDIHPILLVRPWEQDNLFIRLLNKSDYSINTIPVALKPRSDGRDYFRVARCVLYLYRILSKESFDLVHTHGYFADIISTPICKILNIPHLTTCHGLIFSKDMRLYNTLGMLNYRYCKRIISVSSQTKDYLVKNGINESKIVVIQNAIQSSYKEEDFVRIRINTRQYLNVPDETLVIGFIGRLSEEKGVHFLIKAASVLKERNEKFKIIIIGDGPERKQLENLVRSEGLNTDILFAGFQNSIEEWMPVFDIFVLPSLTEGTPMALLEAMSFGIPVIASAVGGVPRVIENGVNGILIEPGNILDLCCNLQMLITDRELRKKLGTEALITINRDFDVREWCRNIEKEYENII